MIKIIKRIVYFFFSENQVIKLKKRIIKTLSFTKDIYTNVDFLVFEEPNKHIYFGYYDISPFNNEKVLFLSKNIRKDYIDICIGDLNDGTSRKIGSTNCYNWQQGARQRWINQHKNIILYNDFENNKYCSKILNIEDMTVETLDWPIYDIDQKIEIAATLNFERLGHLRPGYGYTNKPYIEPEFLNLESVDLIDVKLNKSRKIVTYEMMKNLIGGNIDSSYFNHLSFSPNGKNLLFFWINISEKGLHRASLLVYNIIDDKIQVLENELSVSHYTWVDDNTIIATAYDSLRNCRYYKYITNGKREIIMPDQLIQDGHPTWIGNGLFITDTYPDRIGFQKIFIVNTLNKKIIDVIKIYSTYKFYAEDRCDLHPRLDGLKQYISFDANVEGFRKLYFIKNNINSIINGKINNNNYSL